MRHRGVIVLSTSRPQYCRQVSFVVKKPPLLRSCSQNNCIDMSYLFLCITMLQTRASFLLLCFIVFWCSSISLAYSLNWLPFIFGCPSNWFFYAAVPSPKPLGLQCSHCTGRLWPQLYVAGIHCGAQIAPLGSKCCHFHGWLPQYHLIKAPQR